MQFCCSITGILCNLKQKKSALPPFISFNREEQKHELPIVVCAVDVLVLGFANLVADGISMGFGDYVSSSTERDVAAKERAVTKWDVDNHHLHQLKELLHEYQMLGMSAKDASTVLLTTRLFFFFFFSRNKSFLGVDGCDMALQVVSIFAKYKDILVDEKMMAQKGMLPPGRGGKPWKNGLVTFAAFILFGSTPLLSFIVLIPFTDNEIIEFAGACVLSGLSLALLGVAKAKIAGQGYAASAMATLLNGAAAASAAYGLGWMLRNVASSKE